MIASLAGAGPPSITAAGCAALIAAVKAIDPSTPRAAKADPDTVMDNYRKRAAAQPPLKGSVAKAAIAAKREVYGKKVVDGGKPQVVDGGKPPVVGGVKRSWTENCGTEAAPKVRQVRVGTFVFSESQGRWLPRDDEALP